MSLLNDLARIDRVVESRGGTLPPPASWEQLEALRAVVTPMTVPEEVFALYEWHNGCALDFLSGYGMRSIEETTDDRWFDDPEMDPPPAMLFLSELPGGTGLRVGVTLGLPGVPDLPGVWAFETHDATAFRSYESLNVAIAIYASLMEELPASVDPLNFPKYNMRRIPGETDWYRLPDNPDPIHWAEPPTGPVVNRSPGEAWTPGVDAWPDQWTASLAYR